MQDRRRHYRDPHSEERCAEPSRCSGAVPVQGNQVYRDNKHSGTLCQGSWPRPVRTEEGGVMYSTYHCTGRKEVYHA